MDVLHNLLKWIDHNRGLVVALVLAMIVSVWMVGCQPKTQSILTPPDKVTPSELAYEAIRAQMEVNELYAAGAEIVARADAKADGYNELLEIADANIDRQIELRKQVIEIGGGLATAAIEGTISPAIGIAAVLNVLTGMGVAGLGYDNVRKGRKIKKLKDGESA